MYWSKQSQPRNAHRIDRTCMVNTKKVYAIEAEAGLIRSALYCGTPITDYRLSGAGGEKGVTGYEAIIGADADIPLSR